LFLFFFIFWLNFSLFLVEIFFCFTLLLLYSFGSFFLFFFCFTLWLFYSSGSFFLFFVLLFWLFFTFLLVQLLCTTFHCTGQRSTNHSRSRNERTSEKKRQGRRIGRVARKTRNGIGGHEVASDLPWAKITNWFRRRSGGTAGVDQQKEKKIGG
jgi:predicted membrane protein